MLSKISIKIKRKQKPFRVSIFQKFSMKISFALIDKSFSFSPKKPFQILAERRHSRHELTPSNLHFPNWRRVVDDVRTYCTTITEQFFITKTIT